MNGKCQFHPIGLGNIVCSDAEMSVLLLPAASEGDMGASFRTLVEGPTIASVKLGLLGCDATSNQKALGPLSSSFLVLTLHTGLISTMAKLLS